MAVTSKQLSSAPRARAYGTVGPQRLYTIVYGAALLLAALAVYALISVAMARVHIVVDDFRYGRPRTTQISGLVGHGDSADRPTQIMALNLNRQVVIVELPGGDAAQARAINGPYLFGADQDLTPVVISLQDMDGDGVADLLLDVRQERLVYLNRDGVFRLPTAAESAQLKLGIPK